MVNIFGYPCIPEKNPTKNIFFQTKKTTNIDPNTKGNDGLTLFNFQMLLDTVLGTKYKE